jgi:purine-binding chemotaxis protein CheW
MNTLPAASDKSPAVKSSRARRADAKQAAPAAEPQPVKKEVPADPLGQSPAMVKPAAVAAEGEQRTDRPPKKEASPVSAMIKAHSFQADNRPEQLVKEVEAAAVGRPAAADAKKGLNVVSLVIFKLANEYYGVEIGLVESIIKMQPYTILPHVPKYIVGVTNLRGYVLPVIDLRTRFGLPIQEETPDTRIMVLLIKGEKVGMIVDEVNEVTRVVSEDIDPTPPLIVNIKMEIVDGIAKLRDENKEFVRVAILLNMEKALKVK